MSVIQIIRRDFTNNAGYQKVVNTKEVKYCKQKKPICLFRTPTTEPKEGTNDSIIIMLIRFSNGFIFPLLCFNFTVYLYSIYSISISVKEDPHPNQPNQLYYNQMDRKLCFHFKMPKATARK